MIETYDYFVQFFVREDSSKERLSGMATCRQKQEVAWMVDKFYQQIIHRFDFGALKDFSHLIFCLSRN